MIAINWAALLAIGTACIAPVQACPVCESEIGRRVRATIFNEDFGYHIFAMACPFLLLLALIGLMNLGCTRSCGLSRTTFGWGLFNLVEGIIDHHVLYLHHVTETEGHLLWDLVFLASGIGLIVLGWMLIRAGRAASVESGNRSTLVL